MDSPNSDFSYYPDLNSPYNEADCFPQADFGIFDNEDEYNWNNSSLEMEPFPYYPDQYKTSYEDPSFQELPTERYDFKEVNRKGKGIYVEEQGNDDLMSVYEFGSSSKVVPKKNKNYDENEIDKFTLIGYEGNIQPWQGNEFYSVPVEYNDAMYQFLKEENSPPIQPIYNVFKRLARKEKSSVARLLERMGCAVTPTMKRKILAYDDSIHHQGTEVQTKNFSKSKTGGPQILTSSIRHNKLLFEAEQASKKMKVIVQILRSGDHSKKSKSKKREISDNAPDIVNTPMDISQDSTSEKDSDKIFRERLQKLRENIKLLAAKRKEISCSEHDQEFIEINVVETRASARETSPQDEENVTEELRSTIKQRDEQIDRLEQKIEELMTAIQTPSQKTTLPAIEIIRPEVVHLHDENIENEESSHEKREHTQNMIPEKELSQLVEQKVKETMAQVKSGSSILKGKPYPEEFDLVQYPKGFIPPLFKMFDGTGNPRQHLAHFRASCCNAGGSDALLFRQFVNSLTGVAFDWYAELPNNSVKTFTELENMFIQRFAGAQHHVTVGDLVVEKQKPGETLVDYILRWRNLSMKCEPQLQEQHAVEILLKNIHGPIAFMLKGFTIKTFEKLLNKAANLQEEAKQMGTSEKSKPVKILEKKTTTMEKGKQVMQIQPEQKKQRQNQPQQPSSSQLQFQQSTPPQVDKRTIADRMNKEYPFKTEAVVKIFRGLLKIPEFKLPEAKRPAEVDLKDHPNYCLYHRMLGHKIEDCFVFKDWLERNFKQGNITIPKEYLKEPEKGSVNVISVTANGDHITSGKSYKEMLIKFRNVPKESVNQQRNDKDLLNIGAASPFVSFIPSMLSYPTRVVVSDEGRKSLKPLTLYDFMLINKNVSRSAYILTISDGIHKNEQVNFDSMNNILKSDKINDNFDNDNTEDETFTLELGKTPISIELESSDSETQELNDLLQEITEINLRSGKVLPPRMAPIEKEKQIVAPMANVSPIPEKSLEEREIHGKVDYNILAHLRKLPAKLSIYDALVLSKEMREALIKALLDPEICLAHLTNEPCSFQEQTKVTFSDSDLLLGTTEHNRPLYITLNINNITLPRVLIDPGASINIMSLRTLAYLDIEADRLSTDTIMLRGFNQQGERAVGSITLLLKVEDLVTTAKFHVIDSDTSFNALLGRPWLHENKMVPSSLHQCIKYLQKGKECCIIGDVQPFSIQEIGIHEDATYYTPIEKLIFSRDAVSKDNEKEQNKRRQADTPEIHLKKKDIFQDYARSRGRGRVPQKEIINMNKSPRFEIHFEDERKKKIISKEPQFKILLESEIEGNGFKSMYEQINHYVDNITLTPLSPSKVEDLVVKEIHGKDKKTIKFRLGSTSSNVNVKPNDENFSESMKIPFELYSPCVQKIIRNCLINKQDSSNQPYDFEYLWNNNKRSNNSKEGIGFGVLESLDDTEFCLVVTDNLTFELDPTIENAPPEFEDEIKSTMDELKEINLGTNETPKPTFISNSLNEAEIEEISQVLKEYKDCFAWNYDEMPGLAPEVVVHKLGIDQTIIPVKQGPRRMRIDIEEQVITEVKKLIEANFIREEKYPTWLANIVPVKKKNGQIRVCVDFRDLNKACPKDEFPLPIPELMIDIASTHAIFSFMDGMSGYNQIKMSPEDESNTAFRTPIGIYCYKVMPFGLKNAGATYQRAMTRILDELIHKQVECYVDDLVVNSKYRNDHIYDLRIVFERLRQYNLKMNPLKCAFGVTSGKFLGFVVRHRGIEIDPLKIEAIINMPPPKNLTQLRSFQGKLAYIRRFISNLSGRCQPLTALTRKDAKFLWDEKCQQAFENIKHYLMSPPVLAAPMLGRPLILYTAALESSLGALLAQINDKGKENALYYLSRCLNSTETRYPAIEKQCLALIFATQKLRHYMLSHKVTLISRINPLQYLMTRPTLSGRLARWAMLLLQFDITFVPLRAMKGQILADFLAAHPLPEESFLNDDLPDEQIFKIKNSDSRQWELYFDGASSATKDKNTRTTIPGKAGVGIIFITPDKGMIPFSYHLTEPCTNNEAEYEALITGLELAVNMNIENINVYGDSQLIINQIAGKYKILKSRLEQYVNYVMELLCQIPNVTFFLVPRKDNSLADVLAKLAKEFACPEGSHNSISIKGKRVLSRIDVHNLNKDKENIAMTIVNGEKNDDWRQPIIEYLQTGTLPNNNSVGAQIKQRALSYALIDNILYRRSFQQMWLRCLNQSESQEIIKEVHSGLCGAHQSGPKMKMKIKRMGYYWPSMMTDCLETARKCHQCQIHGVILHQPPNILHPTIASWPFECWGTDIVGPIDPPSTKGHKFILAATDYFSKWAEAVPLREVRSEQVLYFLKTQIVYRFGVPRRIISDNGLAFKNTKINNFVQRHGIDWRYSTIYYPKANGLAEAFNKTLVQILKKTLTNNPRQWHEKLIESLWAYRTTYRTPTRSTPFALVYGSEAILPLEIQIPSLRVALTNKITEEENAKLRLEELESLEGKRLQAQQNLELYQAKMVRAHDKLVRPRTFQIGDLVLVLRRPILAHRKIAGKFEPMWEGPYVIEKTYSGGSYQLIDCQGDRILPPINGRFLKKYIAT